ncbi:hypothetical protein SPBR_07240 [Sporothrix brasiliensis 5110]|uniref:Uncharacterized protein n=1 Tax=Sporothrix brasiliensis 5110 TaxID=1398154 RepID=A0A0C2IPJ5_9PEZI|nr:uncharacterized protein SPBR_07240 [Sporothrix brasiliensis 5110]KIH88850.1 hypothetical protein SPBR_07240 [Sporothrix brasiliensis 5110]
MPRSFTAPSGPVAAGPISSSPIRRRPSSRKHQRPEPNKLQRRIRTYSFESGRADNLEIGNAGTWKGAARRKPSIPSPPHANGGPLNGSATDGIGGNTAQIERNPTLHHSNSKRDGRQRMSRTKSSRRRKNADDRAREAKIKALSNPSNANDNCDFTPTRPAAESWTAGRPMKRETMRVAHPNSVAARYARKLPSDISLPMAESIDSAMSSDSDQVAFVISPFAALAPKPTLRYASQPRASAPGNGGGYFPARSISQKRKLSKPIPEATLTAHKRVDDLANDMNASDLRELMERDARRRDRRRVQDEERAARRLARQAEKHRLQQGHLQSEQPAGANSARPLAPAPRSSPELARGVLGREAVGLGPGTTSAVVTSAVRRESPTPPPSTPSGRNSIMLEERPERDIDDPLPQDLRGDYSTPSAADRQDGADLPAVNSGLSPQNHPRN